MSRYEHDSGSADDRVRVLSGDNQPIVGHSNPPARRSGGPLIVAVGMLAVGGLLGYVVGASSSTSDASATTTVAAPGFAGEQTTTPPELLQTPTSSTVLVGLTDVTPLALRIPALANHFIAGTFDQDGRRQSFVWQPVEAKARFDPIEPEAVGSWDATGTYFASQAGLDATGRTGSVWLRGRGPIRMLDAGGTEPQWHPTRPLLAWLSRQLEDDPVRLFVARVDDSGVEILEIHDLSRWLAPDTTATARLVGWGDWGFAIQSHVSPSGIASVLTISPNGSGLAGAAEMQIAAIDPIDGAISPDGTIWYRPDLLEANAIIVEGPGVATRLGGHKAWSNPADQTIVVVGPDGAEQILTLAAVPVAISQTGLVLGAIDDTGRLLIVDVRTGEAMPIDIPGELVTFQIGVVD